MTKDLINIIDNNIKYLKNCLDLTEAHITWGTKSVKMKYSNIKERLLNKLQEEKVYRRLYLNPPVNTVTMDESIVPQNYNQLYRGPGTVIQLLNGQTITL